MIVLEETVPDRVLKEIPTDVRDIVQKAVIKIIPKKKKCKSSKEKHEEIRKPSSVISAKK